MTDTRQAFLQAATSAFAERGFYGTSIAAIAQELPYTKQALLHHFGSKEKLYGEVLKVISERLMEELASYAERYPDPRACLEATLIGFYHSSVEEEEHTRLLLRELQDNKRRAEMAQTWYLKAFLDTLTALAQQAAGETFPTPATALAFVYQILGAITYYAVSGPTLRQMLGKKEFNSLAGSYEQELKALIVARIG